MGAYSLTEGNVLEDRLINICLNVATGLKGLFFIASWCSSANRSLKRVGTYYRRYTTSSAVLIKVNIVFCLYMANNMVISVNNKSSTWPLSKVTFLA